jgi:hypothetical protein
VDAFGARAAGIGCACYTTDGGGTKEISGLDKVVGVPLAVVLAFMSTDVWFSFMTRYIPCPLALQVAK